MINSKKLSLVSHAWKLWLAEMTAFVLLLRGWDAESECWGWDLFDTYFQTGEKKKKSVIYFLLLQPAPNFQFTLIAMGTAVLTAIYFSY